MRNNIKRFRQEKFLLQRELASIIGVSKETISDWEVGDRDPTYSQQKALAVALKVPVHRLFPDWVPEPSAPKEVDTLVYYVGKGKQPKRYHVCTMNGLRQSARIKMGEKMIVRLKSVTDDGTTFVSGHVVQITPNWFRVKMDKSGYSTCVHYQAFLAENDVRRAN